jgi:acetoin utilization deacetylase AcuC-like enzyme
MVTALVLKAEGKVRRIGILDCDQHYGDGTAEIMDELAIGWIQHITQGHGYSCDAKQFIEELPDIVRGFIGCDLLIYQAGADPHICDPLGGFLSTEELAERDRIVFSVAKAIGIPVVWNLAGGYQEPLSCVIDIHRNTMKACVAEYIQP